MRTTIYLADDLNARLRRLVPRRGLNRFINQALAEKIDALERQQLDQAMKGGYLATRAARTKHGSDWSALDSANWPA